jgi:tyrosine-protein phosphatase SIW14
MNTKINALFLSVLAIFLLSSNASSQTCQASQNLPNLGCINANLYRGAQPTEEGFKELARRGVKTIINLRNDDENARLEETEVVRDGMKYINLPLGNWLGPKDEKIAAILKQINAPENQPVFVHCKRGADRTGTVIAVYRISHDGWTAKQAQSEAKSYDFGWWQFWMKDYIKDYYNDFKTAK